ncbi:hypothetical protein QMO31_32610, partial [Pseudomonas aeruginosa]|nr:hypothetical protein [Pseudomonas aeruginosa]
DQGPPPGDLFTLRRAQLRPPPTRGLGLAGSFAVQDGWLGQEEGIRSRARRALGPSGNGDRAGGGGAPAAPRPPPGGQIPARGYPP